MASEDAVSKTTGESAVSTIVNLAEEAKLASEGVKAPSHALVSICKSLIAGGVAGGVWVFIFPFLCLLSVIFLDLYSFFVEFLWIISLSLSLSLFFFFFFFFLIYNFLLLFYVSTHLL